MLGSQPIVLLLFRRRLWRLAHRVLVGRFVQVARSDRVDREQPNLFRLGLRVLEARPDRLVPPDRELCSLRLAVQLALADQSVREPCLALLAGLVVLLDRVVRQHQADLSRHLQRSDRAGSE